MQYVDNFIVWPVNKKEGAWNRTNRLLENRSNFLKVILHPCEIFLEDKGTDFIKFYFTSKRFFHLL